MPNMIPVFPSMLLPPSKKHQIRYSDALLILLCDLQSLLYWKNITFYAPSFSLMIFKIRFSILDTCT